MPVIIVAYVAHSRVKLLMTFSPSSLHKTFQYYESWLAWRTLSCQYQLDFSMPSDQRV